MDWNNCDLENWNCSNWEVIAFSSFLLGNLGNFHQLVYFVFLQHTSYYLITASESHKYTHKETEQNQKDVAYVTISDLEAELLLFWVMM